MFIKQILMRKVEMEPTEKETSTQDEENRSWSNLPLDLVDLVASRLSLLDHIRFPSVCKSWSLASSPIRDAKPCWPRLMYLPKATGGQYNFFDPFDGKVYPANYELPVDERYALCFARDGWMVLCEDDYYIVTTKAFEDGLVLPLPNPPSRAMNYCFSSPPMMTSDCIFFGIGDRGVVDSEVTIGEWRYGDEDWIDQDFTNNLPFLLTDNSPVFHEGKFYCLGRYGNLGVYDPENKTWTILDKPAVLGPLMNLTTMIYNGKDEGYLVKTSKGDLLSVFNFNNRKRVLVMRLDQSTMVWKKVKDLDDEIIFVSAKASVSLPAPVRGVRNRIYFPRWYIDDNRKKGVYYCLKSKKFNIDARCEQEEVVDCAWIIPTI